MRIYNNFDKLPQESLVACIGFFDGIHLGHRYMFRHLKSYADAVGARPAVVTFSNHPRSLIHPDHPVRLIDTPEEKCALLESLGIEVCFLLDFTPELRQLSAEDFLRILAEKGHIKTLLVGYDHRFGHNRTQGFDDYVQIGKRFGMTLLREDLYEDGSGRHYSSSEVRQALEAGRVQEANELLGRPFMIDGIVVHGHSLGRKLGFPTANILPQCKEKIIPANGVYATVAVTQEGDQYPAMVNIGCRPTVASDGETTVNIEAHLIDFEGNLYDKKIRLQFLDRIRDERKMKSLQELQEQLARDRETTKAVWAAQKTMPDISFP